MSDADTELEKARKNAEAAREEARERDNEIAAQEARKERIALVKEFMLTGHTLAEACVQADIFISWKEEQR